MTTARLALDPALTLAFAMHNTKGGYALLLGSGVSRAAAIPTGWEVIQDFARRLAVLEGADPGPDPAAWYAERFQEEPSYSRLLEALAPSATERRELLRGYFEPTPDERAEGRKTPTATHRAVAQLVADGYVRVILTTNFDQLLETAIRDAGVAPAVVSTPGDVAGMMPLHLAPVTVVKLHGDYLDTRLKNTPEELAAYDPTVNALLDRIFDEYGLVVCGWSAAWDEALRAAIRRCPSRRFTTYWAVKGDLTPEARDLVDWRRAEVVAVDSADAFFTSVAEKVAALEDLTRSHPASTAAAVAAMKRYLPDPAQRIRLHDVVMNEAESVRQRVAAVRNDQPAREALLAAVAHAEAGTETLMALMAAGGYFGDATHRSLWTRVIEHVGRVDYERPGTYYPIWRDLQRLPAQLALYAAGIGAVAAGEEETLADLLLVPRLPTPNDSPVCPAVGLHVSALSGAGDWASLQFHPKRHHTPMSDHLCTVLRPAFRDLLPDDRAYEQTFDRFEYLVSLAYAGVTSGVSEAQPTRAAGGRFVWRNANVRAGSLFDVVRAEIERAGAQWFLLRRGLFSGSMERLLAAKADIDKLSQSSRFW